MIDGDICPKCEKGKLRKTMKEIEEGIQAEGFKCGN